MKLLLSKKTWLQVAGVWIFVKVSIFSMRCRQLLAAHCNTWLQHTASSVETFWCTSAVSCFWLRTDEYLKQLPLGIQNRPEFAPRWPFCGFRISKRSKFYWEGSFCNTLKVDEDCCLWKCPQLRILKLICPNQQEILFWQNKKNSLNILDIFANSDSKYFMLNLHGAGTNFHAKHLLFYEIPPRLCWQALTSAPVMTRHVGEISAIPLNQIIENWIFNAN